MIKGKSTKREYWLGIRGIYMIWHGQWADPELKYKNHICNYYDIEDSMFQFMKERIADGEDWGDPNNDDDFADFCRAHADYIKSDIIDFSDAMNESLKVSRKNKKINESGDSLRGQYMLGRLERNRHDKDPHTSISAYRTARKYNDADEKMWKAYVQGWDDEGIDLPTLKRRNTKYNYEFYKNDDMNKICKQFINYIEKSDAILQLIVDYMSGNQNGEKYSSPLPEVIPMFEDDVLGYECTSDMKKAIERAFNEWWHYAEAELMPEEYYDVDESYRPRKNRKMLKEGGHIYVKNDDGSIFTNSKNTWRGVKGTTFIWHGEWADPEILYDGEELNASQLEDYAWDVYKTECRENGKTPNEREFDNLPTKWFKEVIDDYMFGMFADQY